MNLSEQEQIRRASVDELRKLGIDPTLLLNIKPTFLHSILDNYTPEKTIFRKCVLPDGI